jgi:hypothetical protein
MSRRSWLPAVLLGGVLLLSGCGVTLPSSGPVVETTASASSPRDDLVIINPRRPAKGDSPDEIVRGFLDAMTATPPIKTSVAREFLTADARENWQPTGIIAYSTTSIAAGPRGTDEVELTLLDADHTDARGGWLGPLTDADATFAVPLDRERGEWRISAPPDFLMVPRSWFEQRLRQVSLYFFDPTGTLLVPEPVFAPAGVQFASTLVNGLLQGPSPGIASSELTFLPEGLRPVVSVPVSDDGVAKVDLISDATDVPLAPPETERLVAQLAWTLRQDLTISAFQLTIGGRDVKLSNGESEFRVEQGSGFAPYVADASPVLYGLRDGRLVAGSPRSLDEVSGPFGQRDYQLGSVSLDMRADQAAGVTSGGTTLWLGSVDDADDTPAVLINDGVDLLRPAWDFQGRLWTVDRRPEGAVVEYSRGTAMRTLDVPGITGEDVKDFLVSRDGSRIIAVVRRDARTDAVVVSRVLTTGDGQVVRALPAGNVTAPGTTEGKIRDIAWRSPTTIVYLQPVSRRLFQVRSASVDGASIGVDIEFVTINDEVLGLVGSPTPDQPTYAFARGALMDLVVPRDQQVTVEKGVTELTYVG